MGTKPVSYRLLDNLHEDFMKLCHNEKRTPSQMTAIIVQQYLKFSGQKSRSGDITMARHAIKIRHNSIKKSDIPQIAKNDAKYIIKQMKIQIPELSFEDVLRRITEWNEENKLSFHVERLRNNVTITQFHELGERWSEIQCRMYCNMFEIIKATVITKDWSETMFTFEIIP